MYIDYSRLWKLLVEKGLTKSELIELTGISSRVIAKMTKCETVTTDTIARICTSLDCRVEDMMECVRESEVSFLTSFKKSSEIEEDEELYRVVVFEYGGLRYRVYVTKERATHATHIHCRENGTVYVEHLYPFGGLSTPRREEQVLLRPGWDMGEVCIVLITGKPGLITGLDEGMFISAANKGRYDGKVFVMSEARFKLFDGVGR